MIDDRELSAEIITHTIRSIASEFPYLQKAVYALKPMPEDNISSVCSDYEYLYYAPRWVAEQYIKDKDKLKKALIHSVLHSLYLHPSMISENDKVFDTAADFAVFCLMNSAELIDTATAAYRKMTDFIGIYNACTTAELYELAESDSKALKMMTSVVNKLKEDDHSLWYTRRKEDVSSDKQSDNNAGGDFKSVGNNSDGQSGIPESENIWSGLRAQARSDAQSEGYGSSHGNMFMEIKKPDRFSRFSYLEYLRRFAVREIVGEDPDTLDLIMYTWGMDNLDDTPIIEFSEVRERCTATDIIIAVDMSGSCAGDVAVNFLRQIYTLFEQMNIRSAVNIHVVTFDTQIIEKKIIRSRKDASELVKNYSGEGWGGTDFRCVYEYADKFSENNHGRKLKGLFFFSDAMGIFPDEKPSCKTTFFVPVDNGFTFDQLFFLNIPEWVELVHYVD
ncbi:MAG: VWA-like domain-containing protein [Huintestinicola sp.]